MGGSDSKIVQLNESITTVTTDVIVKSNTEASGGIVNKQNLVFGGTGKNFNILQDSKIKLDVLQKSDVNASMQDEIFNKIMAEIEKEKSGLPEITATKSDTEVKNIVRNNINSSFSQESLAKLELSIELDQNITFLKGSAYEDMKITQSAKGVGKLINDMSGSIVKELASGTDLESKNKDVTKNPIADVVTSVADGISNVAGTIGNVFGFSPQMVMLFFAVVIVGYFIASKTLDKQPNAPVFGRPPMGYGPPPRQQQMGYGPPPRQQQMGYGPPPGQQQMGYGPPPGQQQMGYV